MSFVRLSFDIVESAVEQVKECEGECPAVEELSTLIRYASDNEEPIYVSAEHLAVIESYL
jgi:hypothetical protein